MNGPAHTLALSRNVPLAQSPHPTAAKPQRGLLARWLRFLGWTLVAAVALPVGITVACLVAALLWWAIASATQLAPALWPPLAIAACYALLIVFTRARAPIRART
jgi:hypothetical protein